MFNYLKVNNSKLNSDKQMRFIKNGLDFYDKTKNISIYLNKKEECLKPQSLPILKQDIWKYVPEDHINVAYAVKLCCAMSDSSAAE